MIHPELQSFFDANAAATTAKRQAVNDQLTPNVDLCADVHRHVLDLQAALTKAELAPHDADADTQMNWMHVQLRATIQRAEAYRMAGRDLAVSLGKLDRGLTTTHEHLAAAQERKAAASAAPSP